MQDLVSNKLGNSPRISVIVPVYNVAKYLDRCVFSILHQTFTNFELLLVDDGSTDESRNICDRYAEQDDRVRVFHKVNGGVSSARNLGLDNALGIWITFIDSDDWVEHNYLENLVANMQNHIDLVITGYDNVSENVNKGRVVIDYNLLFLGDVRCYTVPWGKLYRANVIKNNHIRFLEKMKLGEDTVFLWTYMLYTDSVCCVNELGYHYEADVSFSLSKRLFPIDNELFAYEQIIGNMLKLIAVKNIIEEKALERLTMFKVYFIKRVLDALYHNDVRRRDRLIIMRKVDVDLYSSKLYPTSYREYIFVYLLKKRYYVIYDLLRSSVVSLKRLIH